MNRAERRRAAKSAAKKPVWHNLTPTERKERLFRNGITDKDLEENFNRGKKQGITDTVNYYEPMFYSSLAIALHELYGFGGTRLLRAFERAKQIQDEEICVPDMTSRCYKETKLKVLADGWDLG